MFPYDFKKLLGNILMRGITSTPFYSY